MDNLGVCVSVSGDNAAEFRVRILSAAEYADVIELRLDYLHDVERDLLLRDLPDVGKRYLLTFRPESEGGVRGLSLQDRIEFWKRTLPFARAHGHLPDIESDLIEHFAGELRGIRHIVSHHDFSGRCAPDEVWSSLAAPHGSIIKIAMAVEDAASALRVWRLIETARADGRRVIPVAMGDGGRWTRVVGLAHGAEMTYASLESGVETAPGQISARELVETYRVRKITEATLIYGVLGDPVAQSISPYMHNPAFAAVGFNAVFLSFLVKDIDRFIREMVRGDVVPRLTFGGFSVTMPHKQAIMPYLDAIDEDARKIGAVNTVVVEGDRMIGYNTDAPGFMAPLNQRFGDISGMRVAVAGAGGAARAVIHALNQAGGEVTVLARNMAKARGLSQELQAGLAQIDDFKSPGSRTLASEFDVLVDTTPLGMRGPMEGETLFTADELKGVSFVYDLVTRSDDAQIIREAKKANVEAIGGLEMLVAQGVRQFELWTGAEAPVELMRAGLAARMGG